MKNILIFIGFFMAFVCLPFFVMIYEASAATCDILTDPNGCFESLGTSATTGSGTIQSIVQFFVDTISLAFPGFVVLVFVYFFWGLAKYVSNTGDETKEKEGRAIMTWGVVAVFIAVSLWGIIGWMQTFIGNPAGPSSDQLKINLPHL